MDGWVVWRGWRDVRHVDGVQDLCVFVVGGQSHNGAARVDT